MRRQSHLINELGNSYTKLTVMALVKDVKTNRRVWLCLCDCGNLKLVTGGYLRAGLVKSCGCGCRFPEGVAAFLNTVGCMKKNAKNRGLSFNLSNKQIKKLQQQPCHYCGSLPANVSCRKEINNTNGEYVYNGIDRVDNKKGYEVNNCVTCCFVCNRAKRNMTLPDFNRWIKQLIKFHSKKR